MNTSSSVGDFIVGFCLFSGSIRCVMCDKETKMYVETDAYDSSVGFRNA